MNIHDTFLTACPLATPATPPTPATSATSATSFLYFRLTPLN